MEVIKIRKTKNNKESFRKKEYISFSVNIKNRFI
jgi:hypothetical protein